ncbi:Ribonuclease H-like protein, partial [Dioscorea alata]
MVTSRDFLGCNGSKTRQAKDVCNIVLDNQFRNDCLVVVKIASPLVRLLRIVDSDERPSLGYIYEGIIRARKAIKETFKYVRRLYQPYISILEERWEHQIRQDIH